MIPASRFISGEPTDFSMEQFEMFSPTHLYGLRELAERVSKHEVGDQLSGASTWSGKSKAVHLSLDPNFRNIFRCG